MTEETRTIYSKLSDPSYYGERLLHAIANDDQLINRRGRFKLDIGLLREEPETAARILGATIVVRAEMMTIYDAIDYHALSPFFDVIEKGGALPEYRFDLELGEHNSLRSIKAVKL